MLHVVIAIKWSTTHRLQDCCCAEITLVYRLTNNDYAFSQMGDLIITIINFISYDYGYTVKVFARGLMFSLNKIVSS